jgi:hypothetical protein
MAHEDADFSDEFCQFLQVAVPAVETAELLLVLRRDSARAWSVSEAVTALGAGASLPEEVASRYLEELQARGLVTIDPAKRVQYRPASDTLDAHAATLEKVYRERPVTLIRVIYGLRDSKIRSFADAFKLRRR